MNIFFPIVVVLFGASITYAQSNFLSNPYITQSEGLSGQVYESKKLGNDFQDRQLDAGPMFKINVFGEVTDPGVQRVKAYSRLFEAVQTAGGVLPSGSTRRVELRRGGKTIGIYDLLKLNRTADQKLNPFLQDNDTLFVPVKETTISIQGAVKSQGEYELLEGEKNLDSAINEIALGLSTGALINGDVQIIRFDDKGQKVVIKANLKNDDLAKVQLKDGDVVQVPHKFTINKTFTDSVAKLPNDNISYPSFLSDVFVVGGVKNSKNVPYNPQFRIANYVAMSGGLSRLGRKDAVVTQLSGEKIETNISSNYEVNPGDTIDVGEDKLGPEFWITFMTTLVSLGLSSYAILK